MNAAFLLVTSACLAGQTPAPAGAPPVAAMPAPVISTASPGGYGAAGCNTCDTCCESGRHRLFGGGGGLFRHGSSCDGGCNSCGYSTGHASSCCTPTPAPATCTTTVYSGCDTCGGHGGGGFLSRCRGLFAGRGHGSSCCDSGCGTTTGCASGGCAPSVVPATPAPAPAGEILTVPPKKMPAPKTTTPPAKTSLVPAPQGITVSPAPTIAPTPAIIPAPTTSAPIIEVIPPSVPAVPSITTQPRSPF